MRENFSGPKGEGNHSPLRSPSCVQRTLLSCGQMQKLSLILPERAAPGVDPTEHGYMLRTCQGTCFRATMPSLGLSRSIDGPRSAQSCFCPDLTLLILILILIADELCFFFVLKKSDISILNRVESSPTKKSGVHNYVCLLPS